MTQPKYPNIEVTLVGIDGNAFSILGAVKDGLRRGNVGESEIDEFMQEAMSGDYDHLLRTCMSWVSVN